MIGLWLCIVFDAIVLGGALGHWISTLGFFNGGFVNESYWESVQILQIVSLAVALIGLTMSISGAIRLQLVRYDKIPV